MGLNPLTKKINNCPIFTVLPHIEDADVWNQPKTAGPHRIVYIILRSKVKGLQAGLLPNPKNLLSTLSRYVLLFSKTEERTE